MTPINPAHRHAIFSRLFGNNIQRAREYVASGLVRVGIKANILTALGLITTLAAVPLLAWGAGDKVGSGCRAGYSWYGFWAGMLLILANAFDILDGAVARRGGAISKLGGFLDSSFDRLADAGIFLGILLYYVLHPHTPRMEWLAGATMVALSNAEIISYLKARAENFIESCPVGYWQRGERIAGILIGLFSGHIGTVMVMLAVLGGLTVFRRMVFAARQIRRKERNLPLLNPHEPLRGIMRLALWRYKRGSVPYDVVTAINILMILLVDVQRNWPQSH